MTDRDWENPYTAPRRPSFIPIANPACNAPEIIHYRRKTRARAGGHAAICRPRARPLIALTRDPERVTCKRCQRELERRRQHQGAGHV